jgi:hypothetical protein
MKPCVASLSLLIDLLVLAACCIVVTVIYEIYRESTRGR